MIASGPEMTDDDAIRALLRRLSRRHRSGGRVIERAAVIASGADGKAIIDWIVAHDGRPETDRPAAAERGGLHGGRTERAIKPQRYVLPAGALD
jgi:hypothetical protein